MDYKRACTVLGIIILLSISIVLINNTKEKIVHEKQIDSKLSEVITDEDKRTVNYRKLVKDIKAIEDNKKIKYAKKSENKSDVGVVAYGNSYQGDGYTIVINNGVDEATIYEFFVNQKNVYSAEIGCFNVEDTKVKEQKHTRNVIVWIIIGIMIIGECVLFVKYRAINKAPKDVEDEKMVWYNQCVQKRKGGTYKWGFLEDTNLLY